MGHKNLKFILHTLRVACPSLPSLSLLVKYRLHGYYAPKMHFTRNGIPFYINPVSNTLKMCLGNPEISHNLVRYPVIPKGEFKEVFHGLHWRTDRRFFSPMSTTSCGNVFIGDLIQYQSSGSSCMGCVVQFICQEGQDAIHCRVCKLDHHPQLSAKSYVIGETLSIPVCCIEAVLDVQAQALHVLKCHEGHFVQLTENEYTSLFSPHPMKIKSMQWGGIPVVMVPITLFTDDTSGNKSKQWNKFDSWNFRLEGLSKKENGNLQNIHFICASNKVPVLDMAVPLVQEFTALENEGIIAYDAFLQRNVIVVAPILNIICDNPRGAEVCSHLGATTSKYCRICMADVTTGLHSIGCLRNKPDTLCQIARIQSARTQKEMKQLQKEFGVSAKPNPLLELFIDLHRCTPVEVLHTLLLGPYKYLFRDLMGRLTTVQRKEIQARISSFSFSGFDMKLSRNVAKYFKSFVGRDFKILAQLALFVLPPYLTPGETEVWFALSKVFKFVYCDTFLPEMVDVYKSQCLAFTHAVERNCPELRRKLKIHILLHLPDDMLQFGPASTFNTERCESYNAAIRGRNIYANRHAPSKDIATSFAIQESIRFVCSGGHYDALEKCGDELVKLYKSSEVDDFLRGGASASCEKATYLRGAIRKVGKTKVALGSVLVRVQEIEGNISISSLMENHPQFTLLLSPNAKLI
eukprot:Em0008g252a